MSKPVQDQGSSGIPTAASSPNKASGPSDASLRLLAGAVFGVGLLLLAVNHIQYVMNGDYYLVVPVLGPIAAMLGLAGLISPNVLRSAGKHGQHLPVGYKLVASVFGVVGLVIGLLLAFVVYPPA